LHPQCSYPPPRFVVFLWHSPPCGDCIRNAPIPRCGLLFFLWHSPPCGDCIRNAPIPRYGLLFFCGIAPLAEIASAMLLSPAAVCCFFCGVAPLAVIGYAMFLSRGSSLFYSAEACRFNGTARRRACSICGTLALRPLRAGTPLPDKRDKKLENSAKTELSFRQIFTLMSVMGI